MWCVLNIMEINTFGFTVTIFSDTFTDLEVSYSTNYALMNYAGIILRIIGDRKEWELMGKNWE